MERKMNITKESMKLFLHSLPKGSKFSIISFGTKFEYLKQEKPFDYNDKNIKYVKQQIEKFKSDMGGTNILEPL